MAYDKVQTALKKKKDLVFIKYEAFKEDMESDYKWLEEVQMMLPRNDNHNNNLTFLPPKTPSKTRKRTAASKVSRAPTSKRSKLTKVESVSSETASVHTKHTNVIDKLDKEGNNDSVRKIIDVITSVPSKPSTSKLSKISKDQSVSSETASVTKHTNDIDKFDKKGNNDSVRKIIDVAPSVASKPSTSKRSKLVQSVSSETASVTKHTDVIDKFDKDENKDSVRKIIDVAPSVAPSIERHIKMDPSEGGKVRNIRSSKRILSSPEMISSKSIAAVESDHGEINDNLDSSSTQSKPSEDIVKIEVRNIRSSKRTGSSTERVSSKSIAVVESVHGNTNHYLDSSSTQQSEDVFKSEFRSIRSSKRTERVSSKSIAVVESDHGEVNHYLDSSSTQQSEDIVKSHASETDSHNVDIDMCEEDEDAVADLEVVYTAIGKESDGVLAQSNATTADNCLQEESSSELITPLRNNIQEARFGGSTNMLNTRPGCTPGSSAKRNYSSNDKYCLNKSMKPPLTKTGSTPQLDRKREQDLQQEKKNAENLARVEAAKERLKKQKEEQDRKREEAARLKEAHRQAVLAKRQAAEEKKKIEAMNVIIEQKQKMLLISKEEEEKKRKAKLDIEEKRKEQQRRADELLKKQQELEELKKKKEQEEEQNRKLREQEEQKKKKEKELKRKQEELMKKEMEEKRKEEELRLLREKRRKDLEEELKKRQLELPGNNALHEKNQIPPIPLKLNDSENPFKSFGDYFDLKEHYPINDLNSGEDTDDENHPKKPVPSWASSKGELLRKYAETSAVSKWWLEFRPPETLQLDLQEVFAGKRCRVKPRTSSAIWNVAPMFHLGDSHKQN